MSDDSWGEEWSESDDGIMILDDASVHLIEEPSDSGPSLDTAITRVWHSPYARWR